MFDEEVRENCALHPDRKRCPCGRWRTLTRSAWASISVKTDGPKWIFLWRCRCGADAFDHAEGD